MASLIVRHFQFSAGKMSAQTRKSYFLWSSVMSASLSNDASMDTLNFSIQKGRLKFDMNRTITCGKLGVGKLGGGEEIV